MSAVMGLSDGDVNIRDLRQTIVNRFGGFSTLFHYSRAANSQNLTIFGLTSKPLNPSARKNVLAEFTYFLLLNVKEFSLKMSQIKFLSHTSRSTFHY